MMSATVRFLMTIVMAVALSGCAGDKNEATIPRRHAYPRIEIPGESYREVNVDCDDLKIAVNDAATYERRTSEDGGARFLDVTYPQFNSIIYYTITPVDETSIETVIANRMERISLNLGESEAELLDFDTAEGFEHKVLVSHGDISTPVQFISTDGRCVVISGAAFVKDASPSTADSIAPIVEVLRRDIVYALKTVHR